MTKQTKKIGINWQLSSLFGWGVYGTNLALQLMCHQQISPILLKGMANLICDKLTEPFFLSHINDVKTYKNTHHCPFPVLHPIGNELPTTLDISGTTNIGVIFVENSHFETRKTEKLNELFDVIVTGSKWNETLLRKHGIENVICVPQGISPNLFHPAPKSKLHEDRFIIFSGGKLEYRKGQDIVIEAFKQFFTQHPESLLIFSWDNLWPQCMQEITTQNKVTAPLPHFQNKKMNFSNWLIENNLPTHSFVDLGMIPNYLMPSIIREADIALFSNRAEGGTNLVAMETMACGIPSILSNNTGHLDIISDNDCFILKEQTNCLPSKTHPYIEGWGESSVEEIHHLLTYCLNNKEDICQKGVLSAKRMHQHFSWEKQIKELINQLTPYFK